MKREINELDKNSNSIPNEETIKAIEERRRILNDPNTPKYSNMEDFKSALEE